MRQSWGSDDGGSSTVNQGNAMARRIPRRLAAALGLALVLGSVAYALSSGSSTPPGGSPAARAPQQLAALQQIQPLAALSKPAIPGAKHAYIGMYVQPTPVNTIPAPSSNLSELAEMGAVEGQIGRPLAIVHAFQGFDTPVDNSLLAAVSSEGAIPLIDWSCFGLHNNFTTAGIVAGTYDSVINSEAEQLKAFGKPVFVRWLWEMNLYGVPEYSNCEQQGATPNPAVDGPVYASAFRHIVTLFRNDGATNVAFVWNPGAGGDISLTTLEDFYPGSSYVDWIGLDGYSRDNQTPPDPSFSSLFNAPGAIYNTLTTTSTFNGPPIIIGETGTDNSKVSTQQATYLSGALSDFTSGEFPRIKAFVYYDGTNLGAHADKGLWTLKTESPGLQAFAKMADSPYFGVIGSG
jgi:hypothetical protein